MCGARKQMYGKTLQQEPKQVVVTAEVPKTEYAPKKIPEIKWEPNRLYPELFNIPGLNPFF